MKETAIILWAYIRCHWFCLCNMWRGYCVTTCTNGGKIVFIAAATGSYWDSSIKVQRVFYETQP